MIKAFALLPLLGFAADWKTGSCPEVTSDCTAEGKTFDPKEMTGLWFEYVWTSGFQEGNDYLCSSWTILENGEDKPFLVYNQQTSGVEGDQGNFFQIDLDFAQPCECGFRAPSATYTRDVPEGSEEVQRKLTLLRTNYYSYAVASSCGERTLDDGTTEHVLDYVVLSRDKGVPLFIRKLARDALLEHGITSDEIASMVKSKTKTCWGKDFYE